LSSNFLRNLSWSAFGFAISLSRVYYALITGEPTGAGNVRREG
jgi:hypothetical protein